jgi:dihydroorotase
MDRRVIYRCLGVWLALALWGLPASTAFPQAFDIVLAGGRVMDPGSRLDAVRYVGIRGDEIAEISARPLEGTTVIDVRGLIVAPGFIDLHAHGQTNEANEFQAHDGVTTALELETGLPFVGAFIRSREGEALINFGATVGHGMVRTTVMPEFAEIGSQIRSALESRPFDFEGDYLALMKGAYEGLGADELARLEDELELGLR